MGFGFFNPSTELIKVLNHKTFNLFRQCGFFKRDRPEQPQDQKMDVISTDHPLDESNDYISDDFSDSNSEEESTSRP